MYHGGIPKAYLDGRARRFIQEQAPKVIERNIQIICTNFEFSGHTAVGPNKETLPIGRGQLKLGDCSLYIGEWDQEGNPIGDMAWTCITSDKTIHYQGGMKKVVEYYDKLDKYLVTYIPSGDGTKVTNWRAHIELEPGDARKCVYVGNWVNGELDGENGCLTTDDSCVRKGTFEKDEIVYGESYFVTLQNGVLQRDPSADHYTGAFENGRPHGYGRSVGFNPKKVPCVIEGQFKEGLIYDGTVIETGPTSTSERSWQKGWWVYVYVESYSDGVTKKSMEWPNGNTYTGEFEGRQPHGSGEMSFANKDIYQGKFRYGKQHDDDGVMIYSIGATYTGQWADGMREGRGTMTYFNGDVSNYFGPWCRDRPHGHNATFIYSNNTEYVGDAEFGQPHGLGKMTWENGDIYEGHFKNGKFDGEGTITWNRDGKRGESYVGQWNDGKRTQGIYRWPDRSCVGKWGNDGKFISGSKYVFADGKVFNGSVKLNTGNAEIEPNGPGTMMLLNGVTCTGNWKNVISVGMVTVKYPNGSVVKMKIASAEQLDKLGATTNEEDIAIDQQRTDDNVNSSDVVKSMRNSELGYTYEGRTNKLNQFHGQGAIKWDSKVECRAFWENGLLIGKASIIYPDGRIYVGPVNSNYEPSGSGWMTLVDGTKCIGNWVDGNHVPQMELQYPNGSVFNGLVNDQYQANGAGYITLCDGTIWNGTWLEGQPNGNLTQVMVDGGTLIANVDENYKAHGEGTIIWADGKICYATWNHGVRSEHVKLIYEMDGKEVIYEGDVDDQYTPSGQGKLRLSDGVVCEGKWEKGKPQGTMKVIYPLGNDEYMIYEGAVNDQCMPHGSGIMNLSDGRICKCDFDNGKHTDVVLIIELDGSRYIGPVNDRYLAHGNHGVRTWPSVKSLRGGWENGVLKEDNVTLIYDAGYMYFGPIDSVHYEPKDKGQLIWDEQRCQYFGEMKDGQPHGMGTLMLFDQFSYNGMFENGKMCGEGTLVRLIDGAYYADNVDVEKTVAEIIQASDLNWVDDYLVPIRAPIGVKPDTQIAPSRPSAPTSDKVARESLDRSKVGLADPAMMGKGPDRAEAIAEPQIEIAPQNKIVPVVPNVTPKVLTKKSELTYVESAPANPTISTKIQKKEQSSEPILVGNLFGKKWVEMNWNHGVYKGTSEQGLPDGYGKWTLPNGDTHVGWFELGKQVGLIKVRKENGQEYYFDPVYKLVLDQQYWNKARGNYQRGIH